MPEGHSINELKRVFWDIFREALFFVCKIPALMAKQRVTLFKLLSPCFFLPSALISGFTLSSELENYPIT